MSKHTTLAEFLEKVKTWQDAELDILDVANGEYAQDESKFNNFHVTAMIINEVCPELKGMVKPEHVIMIFQLKHLFSIWGGTSIREPMDGRYNDVNNYTYLHRGVREERLADEEELEGVRQHKEQRCQTLADTLDDMHNRGVMKDWPQESVDAFWQLREILKNGGK